MSERLWLNKVSGPQGEFEVSTIRTDAGGAPESRPPGAPVSSAWFTEETPWPYETVVFRPRSSRGLYHEAYSDHDEAKREHDAIVAQLRDGTLPLGTGVSGPHGNPTLTAEVWHARTAAR